MSGGGGYDVNDNETDIQDISTNTGNTAVSTDNIDTTTQSILADTNTLVTNSATIVTNTGNTATSCDNIDTNTAGIAAINGNILSDTGEIVVNTDSTATNTANIYTRLGDESTLAGVKFYNTSTSTYTGVSILDNSMRTIAQPYTYSLAEGDIPGHEPWGKIGFNPDIDSGVTEDIWPAGGLYVFPTAEIQMQVVSSAPNDAATVIFGNAFGAAQVIQSDATGTTTTLDDVSVNFTAGTPVAVGDCVILDPVGTTPEFGYVTAVAATQLTIAGGFSGGGSAASRYYTIVDNSASTGVQVIGVQYLDSSYALHTIILGMNGVGAVTTKDSTGAALSNLFRINCFSSISVGSAGSAVGNLQIQSVGGGTTYSYIPIGSNKALSSIFTTAADQYVYITSMTGSAVANVAGANAYIRLLIKSCEVANNFILPFFETHAEIGVQDGGLYKMFECPIIVPPKCDLKMQATSGNNNVIFNTALRGWTE